LKYEWRKTHSEQYNRNNLPNIRAYLQPGRKWNIGVKWYLNVRKRRNKVLKLKWKKKLFRNNKIIMTFQTVVIIESRSYTSCYVFYTLSLLILVSRSVTKVSSTKINIKYNLFVITTWIHLLLKFNINNLFGDDHVVHSNLLINLYFFFSLMGKNN
jgi:hypothetical protein